MSLRSLVLQSTLLVAGLPAIAAAAPEPEPPTDGAVGWSGHGLLRVGSDTASTVGGEPPGDRAGGVGASVHWRAWRALSVNGLAQGVFGGDSGPLFELRPELELGPAPWESGALVVAGGGLSLGGRQSAPGAPWVHGAVGMGWQQALAETGALRATARVHLRESVRGELAVGWIWGRPPEPPPPEPEVVEVPPLDLSQLPEDAEIWIPHPWCYWLSVAEAQALLPTLPPEVRVRIEARSHDAAYATPQTVGGVRLRQAAAQGTLLVVAEPGDRIEVGEVEVTPEDDGVATLTVRAGIVELAVVGGGRRAAYEVSVEGGQALWVRAPAPARLSVGFGMGSSRLDPAARDQLTALVEDLGDWRLAVEGGFSPEGNREANLALASARAAAVQQALLELGLPPERVEVRPPAIPEGGGPASSQRVAVIIPLAPAVQQ